MQSTQKYAHNAQVSVYRTQKTHLPILTRFWSLDLAIYLLICLLVDWSKSVYVDVSINPWSIHIIDQCVFSTSDLRVDQKSNCMQYTVKDIHLTKSEITLNWIWSELNNSHILRNSCFVSSALITWYYIFVGNNCVFL